MSHPLRQHRLTLACAVVLGSALISFSMPAQACQGWGNGPSGVCTTILGSTGSNGGNGGGQGGTGGTAGNGSNHGSTDGSTNDGGAGAGVLLSGSSHLTNAAGGGLLGGTGGAGGAGGAGGSNNGRNGDGGMGIFGYRGTSITNSGTISGGLAAGSATA